MDPWLLRQTDGRPSTVPSKTPPALRWSRFPSVWERWLPIVSLTLIVALILVSQASCHRLFADFGDGSKEPEVAPPKPKGATDFVNEGVEHLNEGKLELARTAFRSALKLEPKHVAARLNLATVDLRSGNPALALKRYEELAAGTFAPTDQSSRATTARAALRNIIRIHVWQGDDAKAMASLKRYAAIAPPVYVRQMKLYMVSRFPLSLKIFDVFKPDGKRKVPDAARYNRAVEKLKLALAGACAGAKWHSLACDKLLRPLKMEFKRFTVDSSLGFYEAYNNLAVTRCLLADAIRCKANLLSGLRYYANSSKMLFNRTVLELAFERGFFATTQTLRTRLTNAKVFLGKLLIYAPRDPAAFYLEGVIALLEGSKDRAQKALAKFGNPQSDDAQRLKRWIDLF